MLFCKRSLLCSYYLKEQWLGSTAHVQFSSMECHAISETYVPVRDLHCSNLPQFFSAGPDYSSTEPVETDAEDATDDANNERDQVSTNAEETGGSCLPLCRSTWRRWPRSPCHFYDQEIREEHRREMTKWACICLACKMREGNEKEICLP